MKTIKIRVLSSGLENEIMAEKVMGWRTIPTGGPNDILVITMDPGGEYETAEPAKTFRTRLAAILDGEAFTPEIEEKIKANVTPRTVTQRWIGTLLHTKAGRFRDITRR